MPQTPLVMAKLRGWHLPIARPVWWVPVLASGMLKPTACNRWTRWRRLISLLSGEEQHDKSRAANGDRAQRIPFTLRVRPNRRLTV